MGLLIFNGVKNLNKAFIISLVVSALPVFAFYFFQQDYTVKHLLGLMPGNLSHLHGILIMPFLHSDSMHLWGNTFQMFFGILLLFLHFKNLATGILLLQWIGAGLLLFVLGERGTIHIGSSGVVYGLFGFIILSGFMAGNRRLRLLSLMMLMYYGSMAWGLFPWQEKVSWEGHVSGLLTGLATALFLRNHYRRFTRDKKPDWINDSGSREDPYARFNKGI